MDRGARSQVTDAPGTHWPGGPRIDFHHPSCKPSCRGDSLEENVIWHGTEVPVVVTKSGTLTAVKHTPTSLHIKTILNQQGISKQPHYAAITITKRMNPTETMMSQSHFNQIIFRCMWLINKCH